MTRTRTIGPRIRSRLIGLAGILAFALAALVMLGSPVRAWSYVYWSQETSAFDGATGDAVMRANLDGHGATQISKMPWWANSLTLAGPTLYFDSSGSGAPPGIGRIGIDGSGLQATGLTGMNINPFLTGRFVGFPGGFDGQLASDGSHLYWIGFEYSGPDGTIEVIGRANLDGTNVDPAYIALPNWGGGTQAGTTPATLLVSGGYIYWTDPTNGTIGRATLDGSQVTDAFITLPTGAGMPGDLAADGTYLYWVNGNSGFDYAASPGETTIARANLDGTGINLDFITPAGSGALNVGSVKWGEGLAVSGGYIYWGEVSSSYGNDATGAIERANLDGTGQTDLTFTTHPVISLAVDTLDGNQVPLTAGGSVGGTGTGTGNPRAGQGKPGAGARTQRCRVPRLTGVTVTRARSLLKHADCILGTVKHRKAPQKLRNRVVAQSVPPGRVLKRGSRIGVTISG